MVVPERVGVEIALQVLGADRMVDTTDTAFHQGPEAFDGIGVNVALDVDTGLVADTTMLITAVSEPPIGRVLVGVDHRQGEDSLFDVTEEGSCGDVRDGDGMNSAATLDHPEDGRLIAGGGSASPAASLAADVHFVGFYGASQRSALVVVKHEHVSDAMEHAPCGLVGDADLTFQFFGGDSASCAGHEEDGVEPELERCAALVENRVGGRVDMPSAGVAGERRPGSDPMELANPVLFRTDSMRSVVGVEPSPQPLKTGGIVGEVLNEVHDGVGAVAALGSFRSIAVYGRHDALSWYVPTVSTLNIPL